MIHSISNVIEMTDIYGIHKKSRSFFDDEIIYVFQKNGHDFLAILKELSYNTFYGSRFDVEIYAIKRVSAHHLIKKRILNYDYNFSSINNFKDIENLRQVKQLNLNRRNLDGTRISQVLSIHSWTFQECNYSDCNISYYFSTEELVDLNIFFDENEMMKLDEFYIRENGRTIQEFISYANKVAEISTEKETNEGCYIATAVYNSYDCPQVWTFRRFRDQVLYKSFLGRLFVKIYYTVSPLLVKKYGKSSWFNGLFLKILNCFARILQKIGFESTPYVDVK